MGSAVMNRDSFLQQLGSETFDILVVGGGATGAGVALDAAHRGLKVALVERDDFGAGTSSRSTKLVHGGVRYLETAVRELDHSQYKLVKEALHERSTLLKIAPHLVRPIALVTPLYRRLDAPYYLAGLKLYDWIAGRSGLEPSHYLSAAEALARFPMLSPKGLRGGVVYYDGQFDDARMNVTLIVTACELGAVALNHAELVELTREKGKIAGAVVRDGETGARVAVRARIVVNATGPLVDSVRLMDDPKRAPVMTASSGVHIVLDGKFAPPATGLLIPKTADGRVLFLLPWMGHTLVGTTDNPAAPAFDPIASDADVDFILDQLRKVFAVTVRRQDILAAWSGLRPLVDAAAKHRHTAKITREHHLEESPSGLLTIAGGKWTTYRRMAVDTVEHAIRQGHLEPARPGDTRLVPLAGAEEFSDTVGVRLEAAYGFDAEISAHLAGSYGSRALRVAELARSGLGARLHPSHPVLEAEVVYGARHELARTAIDVLARRTRIAFLDIRAAIRCVDRTVALLAQELGWDAPRCRREEDSARASLEREWHPGA